MKSDLIHAVIDLSHSCFFFENIAYSQMTRYLSERASGLQTQTHHLIIHDYMLSLSFTVFGMFASVLLLEKLLGVIENLLRSVLSITLYNIFLHECSPHFLCLRHLAKIVSEYDQEIPQSQTADNWKSRSTTTRHQEDKLSKATSSLFPINMIAILG